MPFITGGGGGSGAISGVTVSGTAASGQVPVASSSSAGAWSYPPGFEIGYVELTTSVNVTATAEATSTTLINAGAITFDGTAVLMQVFIPDIRPDTAAAGDALVFSLFESTTQLGRLGTVKVPSVTAQEILPLTFWRRFTPSAASHTYLISAFTTSTTGTPQVNGGAGGTSTLVPGFVRFTKV